MAERPGGDREDISVLKARLAESLAAGPLPADNRMPQTVG